MQEPQEILKIGNVTFQTIFGDIRNLRADAGVQPSGTSPEGHPMQASPWVIASDVAGSIAKALTAHYPFQLGDVIVTTAGNLDLKYLFSAVVIDWGQQRASDHLLSDDVIISTARKCIEIAVALRLKSIAFTPWGTRIGAMEAARITALMIQAITAELQVKSGNIEFVYLISNDPEHYQWFVDRAFVFQVMFNQLAQIHHEIGELNISRQDREHIFKLLANLQNNIVIYNEIIGGDKITTGNITDSAGVAVGREAQSAVAGNNDHG